MTPSVPTVLAELAALLVRNAAPDVPAGERAASLGLSAALLGVAAEIWDGEAARLVEENRALRELLGQADEETDLRLSALTAVNDRLRAALIDAHEAAERTDDQGAQERIWAELVASTERRRLSAAPV